MKSRRISFYFALFTAFIVYGSCKNRPQLGEYYYIQNYAIFELNSTNDGLIGKAFFFYGKDTFQIRGHESDQFGYELNLYRDLSNDEPDRAYFVSNENNKWMLLLKLDYRDYIDTFVLIPISKTVHGIIENHYTKPPELRTLYRDTIIDEYRFQVIVRDWNPETFYGNSTIVIRNKLTNAVVQQINSDNFNFNQKLGFGYFDVNFDGINDLMFYNGNNGAYMTMTYDYYLFDKKANRFVLNEQLAEIAGGIGITFDEENKRIISYGRGSCCWHIQRAYIFRNNRFEEVKSLVFDQQGSSTFDGYHEKFDMKHKVNGVWKTKVISTTSVFDESFIDSIYAAF